MKNTDLTECRYCRELVPKSALNCPCCGIKTPYRAKYVGKTFSLVFLALLIAFPLFFMGSLTENISDKRPTATAIADYEDDTFQITILDFVSGTWHSVPLSNSAPMIVENAPYNGYEIRVKNLSDVSHMLFLEQLLVDGDDLSELAGFASYNIPAAATVKCTIYAYPLPENAKEISIAFRVDDTDEIITIRAAV